MYNTKRCPFCGENNTTLERDEYNWPVVRCNICGAKGPCIKKEDREAIHAWNDRVANRLES